MMMPVDRFTETAQDVPMRAAEIMQRYGHNQVDTEHVLLALIEQPQGIVPQLFEVQKVDTAGLAGQLDTILRASPGAGGPAAGPGKVAITPRVVQIINLANEEAMQMKDEKISTEHMFLAILSERDTPAALLLEGAGINREGTRAAIQQLRAR